MIGSLRHVTHILTVFHAAEAAPAGHYGHTPPPLEVEGNGEKVEVPHHHQQAER